MIRVTVEMIPEGDEDRAYTLAQGVIVKRHCLTPSLRYGSRAPSTEPVVFVPLRSCSYMYGLSAQFPRTRRNVWHLLRLILNDAIPS